MYYLIVLEASKGSAGLVSFEAVKENLFDVSFLATGGLLAIFGVAWLTDALP